MRRRLLATSLLLWVSLGGPLVWARPYRVLVTRTPRSTSGGNVELGARYQGLFAGRGHTVVPGQPPIEPRSFHQIGATFRWGIFDRLELGFEAAAILFHRAGSGDVEVAGGEVAATLHGRLLNTRNHLLGVFAGFTFPTGPSDVDILPPFWADGTFDVDVLLLYELSLPHSVRLMVDVGYAHHGTRDPAGAVPSFDIPDALRWDFAVAFHVGRQVLLSLELNARHYFDPELTPLWTNNQHILSLMPDLRVELAPQLVLEAGVGFGLTSATREIFVVRILTGLTYELSLY